MKKLSDKKLLYLFIGLFLLLNVLNSYVVTSTIFNPDLNLYKFTIKTFFMSFIGDLGFLLIILSIILLTTNNKRSTVISLTVATTLLSTSVFLLKIYSFYYGTAFSFANLRTFSNDAPILGKQLTAFLWKNLFSMGQYVAVFPAIIFLVLTIVALANYRFLPNRSLIRPTPKDNFKYAKILLIGLTLTLLTTANFQYELAHTEGPAVTEDLEAINNMGVYTYLTNDFIHFITNPSNEVIIDDDETIEQADLFLKDVQNKDNFNFFGEKTTNSAPIFKDKKLIVLQLESFNNFLINLEVTDPNTLESYEVTPFINSLANNSNNLYYSSFYSNIGLGKTTDAEFSTLTGIVPNGNIVTYYDYIYQDYETLPKLFKEKGYTNYAINGSTKTFYRRDEVYPLLGFDSNNFFNAESLYEEGLYDYENINDYINGWVNDFIIYNKVTEILKKDEKQFIFALSTVLHSPYAEHELITGLNEWTDFMPGQMGRYLDYARYTDNALRIFYETLEQENLLDDVVFMLYGDHKSDLSKKEHSKIFTADIDLLEHQQLAHNVPLIIMSKDMNLEAYSNSTQLVRSQRDLKRTIANLFDLNQNYYFGVDILTSDRTIAYMPLTLDIFTDLFHLSYRSENITDLEINDEEIKDFKLKFDSFKGLNDLLFLHNFFGEIDDETQTSIT